MGERDKKLIDYQSVFAVRVHTGTQYYNTTIPGDLFHTEGLTLAAALFQRP